MLWDGSLDGMRRGYLKRKRVTLWTEAEHVTVELQGVRVLSSQLHRTDLEIAFDVTPLGRVVDAAAKQTLIRDMAIHDPPLDEVIRTLYANAEAGRTSS
jgi:ABC-type uncharacterized transport system ATPase subunit